MGLPRVGILADDLLQQHLLKTSLIHFGFDVVLSTDPERFVSANNPTLELDAWVVDIRHEDDDNSWLDDLLSKDTPVLFGLEKAPDKTSSTFPRWEKKLYSKLRELINITPVLGDDAKSLETLSVEVHSKITAKIPLPTIFVGRDFSKNVATNVWVLGASLGGPEAVKTFLDALPAGLPIAFVYAQHIDPRFETVLSKTIGRHSAYSLRNFVAGEPILCGQVLVAPIEHEFIFEQGVPQSLNTIWPGPYGPSIDQVITNVSKGFGARAGYILFSGMGNDGADAIVNLSDQTVPIWAQLPESCANSSMPENAIATGRVSFIGTPYQLAQQLVNRIKHNG